MRRVYPLLCVVLFVQFTFLEKNALLPTALTTTNNACAAQIYSFTEDFTVGVPPAGWSVNNPDGSEGWESTTTTGSDGNQTRVARMDNYQYNAPGQLDDLVMPSVDLSRITNPRIIFDVAYAPFSASNFETLTIEYATDCTSFAPTTYSKSGTTLATVGNQGNGWAPQEAAHWRSDTLDLTAYKSDQTILKFVQTAGYGNGLFIDNVNVGTDDPPVASFSTYGGCLNNVISLENTSMEAPTSFSWTIAPATYTYQNGTNASSKNPQLLFSAAGTYTASLTVSNANGSDSFSKSIYISASASLPLSEDFTGGVPPTDWFSINYDGDEGWELTTTTGSDGNQTRVARMDNYQYNAPGQLDDLVLPTVDLSKITNPRLVFDVAYAAFSASNSETLTIEYATDCASFAPTTYTKSGLTLATVDYQGNGWGPQEAAHWRSDTLDLTPYKSEQTILKFVQTAGYGNGLFIDNINVGTDDLPAPAFSTYFGCPGDIITFDNNTTELPESFTWSISPASYSFQNGTSASSENPQISFDAAGTYTVTLSATSIRGTVSISQPVYIIGTAAVPLTEDFSGGVPPAGWFVNNPDGGEGWESTTVTGSDGTQTQAVRMDNYQYNAPGQLDDLILPSVDLSNKDNPKLIFDVAYAAFSASNSETLHIEYATDCASFSPTTYSKSDLTLATVDYQGNGWGPQEAAHWRRDTLDLTPYKSNQTILKFVQTAGYGNGLFLDNINIEYDVPDLMLDLKLILSGPYDQNTALMNDYLRQLNYIPLAHPFSAHPLAGNEVTTAAVLANTNVVDWVLAELRDKTDPTIIIGARAGLLLTNGTVVDVDGISPLSFERTDYDDYYISVLHNNHLGVMTATAQTIGTGTNTIDFTTIATYGTDAQANIAGVNALWPGDTNRDKFVDASDRADTWNNRNTQGYLPSDTNRDGTVDAADRSITWNNRNKIAQLP